MEILLVILIIVTVISTTVACLAMYENEEHLKILKIQTELNDLITKLSIKAYEKNNK